MDRRGRALRYPETSNIPKIQPLQSKALPKIAEAPRYETQLLHKYLNIQSV